MATRLITLIRHGEYDPSLTSNPDGDLTALGKKQLPYLVKALKKQPVTAIHVSTHRRAEQTTEPVIAAFPDVPVTHTERLWECVPPPAPQDRQSEYFSKYTDEELETHRQHAARAYEEFFKQARGSNKHDVLITHGNIIRYCVCRVLEVDPTTWVRMTTRNCGITRVLIHGDGGRQLLSYNDIGHLPSFLITDNLRPLTHNVPEKM